MLFFLFTHRLLYQIFKKWHFLTITDVLILVWQTASKYKI